MKITKEQFDEYKSIQESGDFNMLDPQARELSTLDNREWYYIIRNYVELSKKWGD